MFENRHYIADTSIPGLAEAEAVRLSDDARRGGRFRLRGLSPSQLRDLGLDRSASE